MHTKRAFVNFLWIDEFVMMFSLGAAESSALTQTGIDKKGYSRFG